MNLEELITGAWKEHESKTAEVADRIEAGVELIEAGDEEGAAGFMSLTNHAIGDHCSDRSRALRVCEAAIQRLGKEGSGAPFLELAVAYHLTDNEEGALQAEKVYGDDAESKIRVRLMVAQGRAHAGEWEAASATYGDCLHVAESLKEGHKAEQATAIVSNNIASALLGRTDRNAKDDALMKRSAEAARVFWGRVGTWVNEERADYLLSRVLTELGEAEEGQRLAARGLMTIAENGEEPVDQAFLQLAFARACRDCGDAEGHSASLGRAASLAESFESDGLIKWFARELEAAR